METTLISTLERMSRILEVQPRFTKCNEGHIYTFYYPHTFITIESFKRDDSTDNKYVWQIIQGSSDDDIAILEEEMKLRLSNDDEEHIRQKSDIQRQYDF